MAVRLYGMLRISVPAARVDPVAMDQPPHHHIILANPSPGSYCHALAHAYAASVERHGQTQSLYDLCADAFDPVLRDAERADRGDTHDVALLAEVARVAASDALVLVYPIWFGGPPAILKGYVDRVLGAHCSVRRFTEGGGQPGLRGRYLTSLTTSGNAIAWLEERGQRHALREGFDVYLERGFGLRDGGHVSVDAIVPNMSSAHAALGLAEAETAAQRMCERLAAALA